MTTAVTDPSKTPLDNFRETITERIAKDASTLMPDDVLKQLCEDSIRHLLVNATESKAYGREEGWIRTAVKQQCMETAHKFVEEILKDKTEMRIAVRELVKDVLPDVIADTISRSLEYSIGSKMREVLDRSY
jgi:ribosomal protein S3AE